ncbi:tyrosine-type recombinase/integrase [Helicobacter vulpis]|uniref:tyrosine-type recombinase/integrase n=1 Tax=Helicobacter vulpis TaxID=2316076 RepID=UPI000EB1B198|nr:site-specific integrase [Helicobacter vulpis]
MRLYNRNGKLYAEVYTEQGVRKRFSLKMPDTPQNRAKALAQAKEQASPSLEEVGAAYLEQYALFAKPSSLRSTKSRLNTLLKLLAKQGARLITQVDKKLIRAFYTHLSTASSAQVHNLGFLLKALLDFAMEMDYIQANPYFRPKIRQSKPPRQKAPLSQKEVYKVLSVCEDPQLKAYLEVAFSTGARTGEILALKWADIDLKANTMSIARSIDQRGHITPPKTRSSVRTIPLDPMAKQAFLSLRNAPKVKGGYVFARNKNGRRPEFGRKWHKLLKKAQLAPRKLYSTRHTFASLALSRGANLLATSALLGHKNAFITLSAYATYVPQENTPFITLFGGNHDSQVQPQPQFQRYPQHDFTRPPLEPQRQAFSMLS